MGRQESGISSIWDVLSETDNGCRVDWEKFCKKVGCGCSFANDRDPVKNELIAEMRKKEILSLKAEGNWEVMLMGMHVPFFKGEMLFFVNQDDALDFCRAKKNLLITFHVVDKCQIRKIAGAEEV